MLAFIDHYNLRRMDRADEQGLRAQVEAVKHHLGKAADYGADTYILFSRSFEALINYDFAVEGLGDLGGLIYPADDAHREAQARYAACLNEVLDHAERAGIRIVFHTNQFDFPQSLYDRFAEKLGGGTALVCPARHLAFDLLEGKLTEYFGRFPRVAGIQLTLSETQVSPKACQCPKCADMSMGERMARVARSAVKACKPLGKAVSIRTWGNFETEENVKLLPPEVICSTKHTLPDFHIGTPPNPVLGIHADHQEVEFDAWGEYSGYNFFPCYMGEQYAERIKLCVDRGVSRFAIRLNWDPAGHPLLDNIFDRPFGNEVNLHVFCGLVADPSRDPDDLLREYVARVYPAGARDAAFALYKQSFGIQETWLTWRRHNFNDHSRVWKPMRAKSTYMERLRGQIGSAAPEGYAEIVELMAERRRGIEDAYRQAAALIEALGWEVPSEWKHELHRGALNSLFIAHGNCDCLVFYAAGKEIEEGRPLPDLNALKREIRERGRQWHEADPEIFPHMRGDSPLNMLSELV